MKKNNYSDKVKVGDYQIYCDICGQVCWASQSYQLEAETGHGGAIVCPNDRDAIDYGLVPYKILPEQPIPVARINQQDVTTLYPAMDFTLEDPLTGYSGLQFYAWSTMIYNQTWAAWSTPWGSV